MNAIKEFYNKYKLQINKVAFILGFFLFIYIFFNYIFTLIAPFAIGLLLSAILNPLADFLTKKIKAPRWFASLACVLLVIFIITFFGTNLISRIFKEAYAFVSSIPDFIKQGAEKINFITEKYSNFFKLLPETYRTTFESMINSLVTSLTSSIGKIFKDRSIDVVTKLPNLIMIIVLTIVSTFFFINDRVLIKNTMQKYSPHWLSKNMIIVRKGILSALGGYVKAQAIIMSIIATLTIIILTILRYEYALFIGLIIAVVDALPIFGSGFILWPWIAISFLSGDYKMAIGLLITYGSIFLTRQICEPRILGKQIGMHPLVTLMSMYIGLKIFGVFGFIIGPVIVIIVKTILHASDEIPQNVSN